VGGARINVMVVGGDRDARSELAARLSEEPDCAVIGALAPADAFRGLAGDPQPDVVVWDLGDDPEAGLPRLGDAEERGIPIVALVGDDRDGIRALAHGASGILASPAAPERIVLAARAVFGGLMALDPAVAGFAGFRMEAGGQESRAGRSALDDTPVEPLTRRELEVLRLMAQGLGNKQIAERLGITEHTAKFHVHTILGKLSTQSRTEAVVRAAQRGLIAI
jgi:two-component system, NarL family, nitrate/nitrite response regulator NarL